jgi:hypothetical protein
LVERDGVQRQVEVHQAYGEAGTHHDRNNFRNAPVGSLVFKKPDDEQHVGEQRRDPKVDRGERDHELEAVAFVDPFVQQHK